MEQTGVLERPAVNIRWPRSQVKGLPDMSTKEEDTRFLTVCKKADFAAAHYLPNYNGKCRNLHGHLWTIEIAVAGPLSKETGMVVDFTILSNLLKQVVASLDHTLLNDKIENPTAENIALYIEQKYNEQDWGFGKDISLRWIKVWETPDSMAMLEE